MNRDDLVTLAQALQQLRLRAGVADDEVDSLIGVAVEQLERRLGFAIVDRETAHTLKPPSADADVIVPYGKVRGALFGSKISDLRRRLDDGTDASLIGYVIAHPETDQPGDNTHEMLAIEFEALRVAMRDAFTLSALRSIASTARIEIDDASYTGGNVFDTAVNLENEIRGLISTGFAPSAIEVTETRPSDYYALTTLKAPSGGWNDSITQSDDEVTVYLYVGVPASDLPVRWTAAAQHRVTSLWRSRGDANFDQTASDVVVDALVGTDALASGERYANYW